MMGILKLYELRREDTMRKARSARAVSLAEIRAKGAPRYLSHLEQLSMRVPNVQVILAASRDRIKAAQARQA